MLEASHRVPLAGPTFIRLASRLSDAPHAEAGTALSQRLGEWLDWRRAVALARALDASALPAPDAESTAATAVACSRLEDECRQARQALADAIDALDPAADGAGIDDAARLIRQSIDLQRRMQASTGRLRDRARERLRGQSAGMAQLVELDAVMEGVLSPREHALLASIPTLLAAHAERLRGDAATPRDAAGHAPAAADWRKTFHRDLRELLHAELDVRFQPIEALLAALRQHGPLTP